MSARRLNFSQVISMHTDHPDRVIELIEEWDELQSTLDVMGYTGTHVLVDRDDPRHVLIVAEFASAEPGVSAFEEAQKNNDRPGDQQLGASYARGHRRRARLVQLRRGLPHRRLTAFLFWRQQTCR